jgi:hypothetical protein
VGIAVAVTLIRGFARHRNDRVGNFWMDLTRSVVRVLLPISFVFAVVLVGLGVSMSLRSGVPVTGLDGAHHTIALAPTASQEAIKELGTNGGGIFNANSAYPFENPNAWSNLIEIFLLLVIPVCLTRAAHDGGLVCVHARWHRRVGCRADVRAGVGVGPDCGGTGMTAKTGTRHDPNRPQRTIDETRQRHAQNFGPGLGRGV